jgi:hypothetical protein
MKAKENHGKCPVKVASIPPIAAPIWFLSKVRPAIAFNVKKNIIKLILRVTGRLFR